MLYTYKFGRFSIDPHPGQPQLADCHNFFVPVGMRGNGNGTRLKQAQMEVLLGSHYDFAQCTCRASNFAQQRILEKFEWICVAAFDNSNTNELTEIWVCDLTYLRDRNSSEANNITAMATASYPMDDMGQEVEVTE